MTLLKALARPWHWYLAGPLMGLTVPALLPLGGKHFGLSSNLRHLCAMLPSRLSFIGYDWRRERWNLMFALGTLLVGFVGGALLGNPEPVAISQQTRAGLAALGHEQEAGLAPASLFAPQQLFSLRGFVLMVVGGFLVGFGARYAGGCTSGHELSGVAQLQWPPLVALVGFFVGGLLMTHLALPWILRL